MSSKIQRANPKTMRRDTANKVFTLAASARGQVMLLVCVAIFALMGMIAVVADFSFMQHQRNMMQTAADSAAMAGAEELNYGDLVAAGKADAATNGYTDGAGSVTVAINNPPSTGPNAGNAAYVEAIVSKPEPTYFLSVIGINTMTVSVRAVAYEGNGPNCIYVTDPSAAPAHVEQRQRHRTEQLRLAGGLERVERAYGQSAACRSARRRSEWWGTTRPAGSASFTPTPKTGVIAASDPLAYVQAPTVGSCAHTNFRLNGTLGQQPPVRTSSMPAPIAAESRLTAMRG